MDKQLSIEVTTPFLSLKKERAAFHPLGFVALFKSYYIADIYLMIFPCADNSLIRFKDAGSNFPSLGLSWFF